MKGLELSRRFYEAYGKAMLEEKFAPYMDRIAVGLVGEGSECFGFDDTLSSDHDFEPGFCLFVTKEDYDSFGFALERAYAKLPKSFAGYSRQLLSPVGGARRGVLVIDDFYQKYLGTPTSPASVEQWLYLPHESIACACNGQVFCDELGAFSAVRNVLLKRYPQGIRLKKLAAHAIMVSQSGLYIYYRCIARGEYGAAQLAVFEFVKHTISMIYLLNNVYEPFYKWAYRGMRALPLLASLESSLVALTELGNSDTEVCAKKESMEEIAQMLAKECCRQFSLAVSDDLERTAYELQNRIQVENLRNMHIMSGI